MAAALLQLAAAVAEHPGHAVLLNAYGNTLRQGEHFDDAIAVLEQAIAAAPTYAEAHNNLGLAYAVRNRLEPAAEHLRRAARLRPDMAVISKNLGALLVRMFLFPEAVSVLSNVVARDPNYDEAVANLGVAISPHSLRGRCPRADPGGPGNQPRL